MTCGPPRGSRGLKPGSVGVQRGSSNAMLDAESADLRWSLKRSPPTPRTRSAPRGSATASPSRGNIGGWHRVRGGVDVFIPVAGGAARPGRPACESSPAPAHRDPRPRRGERGSRRPTTRSSARACSTPRCNGLSSSSSASCTPSSPSSRSAARSCDRRQRGLARATSRRASCGSSRRPRAQSASRAFLGRDILGRHLEVGQVLAPAPLSSVVDNIARARARERRKPGAAKTAAVVIPAFGACAQSDRPVTVRHANGWCFLVLFARVFWAAATSGGRGGGFVSRGAAGATLAVVATGTGRRRREGRTPRRSTRARGTIPRTDAVWTAVADDVVDRGRTGRGMPARRDDLPLFDCASSPSKDAGVARVRRDGRRWDGKLGLRRLGRAKARPGGEPAAQWPPSARARAATGSPGAWALDARGAFIAGGSRRVAPPRPPRRARVRRDATSGASLPRRAAGSGRRIRLDKSLECRDCAGGGSRSRRRERRGKTRWRPWPAALAWAQETRGGDGRGPGADVKAEWNAARDVYREVTNAEECVPADPGGGLKPVAGLRGGAAFFSGLKKVHVVHPRLPRVGGFR